MSALRWVEEPAMPTSQIPDQKQVGVAARGNPRASTDREEESDRDPLVDKRIVDRANDRRSDECETCQAHIDTCN